jgi:3-oxoacyl-[acyl-carrier protein] reductase
MDLGLKGKIALVAASSRGLGRAVAEELAAEGAALVLCARGTEELEATRAAIVRSTGARVVAISADLSVEGDVASVAERALSEFGHIDILVNNAGGPPSGPFEAHAPEAWRAAYRLTLESAVNLTRAVLPGMKERRWGRILNITSIAVKQPVDGLMLSNSMRAAVTGFARTLATEVAPYGITVNNILPGYTRTARLEQLARATAQREGIAEDDAQQRWTSQIPMGRLGDPKEFAALVAFLASERASFITATSIPVDGGWIRSLL